MTRWLHTPPVSRISLDHAFINLTDLRAKCAAKDQGEENRENGSRIETQEVLFLPPVFPLGDPNTSN